MSGAMAGTLATVLTYPFDLFRTRFSLQGHETRVYTGLLQAFAHTWQQDGLRGFYRGLAPTVLQIIPSMGIMYYSYEVLNRSTSRVATVYLPSEWRKNQQWVTFDLQKTFCGAAAGLISKTSTMPFDVIRKRLQMQHNEASKYAVGGITSYGNVRDCIVKTYRLEVRTVLSLYWKLIFFQKGVARILSGPLACSFEDRACFCGNFSGV